MTSFSATRLPSSQAAAKAIRADVTIVMAGSSPFEPPQSTVSAVGRSTSSRLDMPYAAQPPEFTPAQAPAPNKTSLPGVAPPRLASDNATPVSAEPSPQPACPPLSTGGEFPSIGGGLRGGRLGDCGRRRIPPPAGCLPHLQPPRRQALYGLRLLDRPEGPRPRVHLPIGPLEAGKTRGGLRRGG